MVNLRAYTPDDYYRFLERDDGQPELVFTGDYSRELAFNGPAFSLVTDDGICAIMGVEEGWTGIAKGWCIMGRDADKYMIRITRAVINYLDNSPYCRVEAAIRSDWVSGARWATLIGFKKECRMRRFTPTQDYDLYARIK